MIRAVVPPAFTADQAGLPTAPRTGPLRAWRKCVLIVLAAGALLAALLDPKIGMLCLLPFGLLLALSTGSAEAESGRSVLFTKPNLGMAAAMVVAFGWFWLWHMALGASTLVVVAAAVIALPLALQQSTREEAVGRTVVVTRRSVVLANVALVTFVYLNQDGGVWFFALAVVCVVPPLVLAASRSWAARPLCVRLR